MPVSSYTSLIATSDGEYPTSAQPTGYSHQPESARWVSSSSPSSFPTIAATATFGVTYPGTPDPTASIQVSKSASASASSIAAARMSAAMRSTSSNRSCS